MDVSLWVLGGFLVGCTCDRIICTHHPRSLTHNTTMTSADGIRLLPGLTDPSNLEPKDTGHRPRQAKDDRLILSWARTKPANHISKPFFPCCFYHFPFTSRYCNFHVILFTFFSFLPFPFFSSPLLSFPGFLCPFPLSSLNWYFHVTPSSFLSSFFL